MSDDAFLNLQNAGSFRGRLITLRCGRVLPINGIPLINGYLPAEDS
jgi:hypothetical protein